MHHASRYVPGILVASLLLPAAASGLGLGDAKGTLTLNGETVKLSHAYAEATKNDPDAAETFVRVVLSDAAIPPLHTGSSALKQLAKNGKVHAVVVTLDAERGNMGTRVYGPSLSDGYALAGFDAGFTAKTFDDRRIAGHLATAKEGRFAGDTWTFDVEFAAAVKPYPLALTDADRAAIAAMPPGTAQGTFTVNGKETPLAYAYAVARRSFPGDPESLAIVLSDLPIPNEVLLEDFGLQKMAADGQVHAVEVVLGAGGQAQGGQMYHRGFAGDEPGGGSMSVSVSGMHHFLPVTTNDHEVSGRLLMAELNDFMGTEFHYAASFRAGILRKAAPTYEGKAAAKSGPGKAVLAFLKAASKGDRRRLIELAGPSLAAELNGPDGASMAKMMKTAFPPGLKIVEVTENGDQADVVAMKGDAEGRESLKLHLFRKDGTWRIGMDEGDEPPPPPREPPTPEQAAAAATGPGRAVMAFVDAIHAKDVARMQALSAEPGQFENAKGGLADMTFEILAAAFPWDLRINRVTEDGDEATVEADSRAFPDPLVVHLRRVKGAWKIADVPDDE